MNKVIENTSNKDAITTVLKVLSAVYLVMHIVRLGKELTKKEKEKKKTVLNSNVNMFSKIKKDT